MDLNKFLSVSGLPGVYRLAATRGNGLIIEDLDSGKKKFVSTRKHMFTPLSSVSIYTETDTEELTTIFETIRKNSNELDPREALKNNEDMFAYFAQILPNYDRDRVYVGDIKKVIKWYLFLNDRQLLVDTDEEE